MSSIRNFVLAAAIAAGGFGLAGSALAQSAKAPAAKSNNWLLDAKDDKERFRRIEEMFGGFSSAMIVVGERFDRTYDAIVDGNYDLANYHWSRVKDVIEAGYLRRPGREANAVHLFLKGPWQPLAEALATKDGARIKPAFLSARAACQGCHIAEGVPFMNDQPRFRRTAQFPEQ
jgi:hypothetical protein